jgi:hypothetical protein
MYADCTARTELSGSGTAAAGMLQRPKRRAEDAGDMGTNANAGEATSNFTKRVSESAQQLVAGMHYQVRRPVRVRGSLYLSLICP